MRVPGWVVPALVVLFALAGLSGALMLGAPSVTRDYTARQAGARALTTVFVVEGLRCVDTAQRAASQLEGVPGVFRFTAYASRNRAEVAFDPGLTSPAALRAALEGPVYDPARGEYLFNVYRVVEMDGAEVAREGP